MAKKRTRASKGGDVEILGGLNAITKVVTATQKMGPRRLKDGQIKTGLFVSVGGVRQQLVLQARASDKCRIPHDNDSKDGIGPLQCDRD